MPELIFSKPIEGFVKNNGYLCGTCGISFELFKSLSDHWATKNCGK
jgi:hypothetical protein